MSWVFFALLAPAVYTVVNFIDKHIVSNEVKDYRGMPIYGTITGLLIGTVFWVVTGFPVLPLKESLIVLLTGALTIWASALYFKAIEMEDASKIIILFQTTPIFVLVLSYFLLGERVSAVQILGFVLILASAIGVSMQSKLKDFKLSSAFWLIMLVNLMWAVSAVLMKFAIEATSFNQILSYESWGLGLGGVILFVAFPSVRKAFFVSVKRVRKWVLGLMFLNEGVFVVAKSLTFYAYSIGPAMLVSVLGSTQVFFGILYGFALTLLLPKLFKEDISKASIIKKVIFSALMLLGIYLVQ